MTKFVLPTDVDEFSSLRRRNVAPRPKEDMPTPEIQQKGGPRITVDGFHVEWMGWSFDYGMRPTAGMQFWDVRFKGDRLLYEASQQEASANYAGYSPLGMTSNYMDTNWGNGLSAYELVAGVDCPPNAVYQDLSLFVDGEVIIRKNAICIFEFNTGIPNARHWDSDLAGGYTFYGASTSIVLIVRAAQAVYNYDYFNGAAARAPMATVGSGVAFC